MNPISLFCILAGVTLNAGAQLLLAFLFGRTLMVVAEKPV